MPPRLGGSSNYIRPGPFWSPFKIPRFPSGSRNWMEIAEGYPRCVSCFDGACGSRYAPHPCISAGMPHQCPNLHPIQTPTDVSHRSWLLDATALDFFITHYTSLMWKYPFCSCEICLSDVAGARSSSKYIQYHLFVKCPCDTSSIVLKCNRSF